MMGNAKRISGLVVFIAITGFGRAGSGDEVRVLQKGMPKDVAAFIQRTDECNHWGGEEPYDEARAKRIQRAVKRLGCSKLDSDEKKLRKKYWNSPKVLKVLDQVRDL